MFQKNRKILSTVVFFGSVGLAACGCAASLIMTPCTGSCSKQFRCKLAECNDNFNNDDPENRDYHDDAAWENCRAGADAYRSACSDAMDGGVLETFWDEYLADLKACIDDFGANSDNPAANPENLNACIQGALSTLREEIERYMGDSQNGCGSGAVPASSFGGMFVGEMQALKLAAIEMGNLDGKYPITVNSSIGITTGINITTGSSYDVSQIPCIKSAIAIAIYQTKNGTAIVPIDADLDTSDGTTFDIIFFGSKLIDASEVTVLSIFFDENDLPVMGETGTFTIQNSPISGDWNRDQVLNTQDVIDFLASYDAQTKRADINGDTQVTPADVVEFVNP